MSSWNLPNKFSCDTSRFLLPTFRRPCYQEIACNTVEPYNINQIFSKWTREQGQYYNVINQALLNDDLEVLKRNARFINSLRHAIRSNHTNQSIKVYRGLCIDNEDVRKEYQIGSQFLWPTFTCTSKHKEIAQRFGDHLFEIDACDKELIYRADIEAYSETPHEREVLFYPYSGFRVTEIIPDAKVIRLESVDTITVETIARDQVPESVTIFDESRNMCVYLSKNCSDTLWSDADKRETKFLIGQNQNGYWDSPYRYHHCNGYFIDKGDGVWEEYQQETLHARFVRLFE